MAEMLSVDECLLPSPVAHDENLRALATVAARLQQQNVNAVLVYDIDNVAPAVLPYLAEQSNVLGVKGWQFCRNDNERRTLLKRAWQLNRYKGTPWAIEEVLRVFNAGGTVREWFEYDGEPYHFQVDIELSDRGLSEQEYAINRALIGAYKNARSVLDAITIYLTGSLRLNTGAVLHTGESVTVYPVAPEDIEIHAPMAVAVAWQTVERITVYPWNEAA